MQLTKSLLSRLFSDGKWKIPYNNTNYLPASFWPWKHSDGWVSILAERLEKIGIRAGNYISIFHLLFFYDPRIPKMVIGYRANR